MISTRGLIAATLLLHAASARADDADRCASRAESAQSARVAGKLRAAREGFIECSSDKCPAVVRRDCGRWLSEVETELPTVVVKARDNGQDVADVRVVIDGVAVAQRLDGLPIAVDAGTRTFRFERAGRPAITRRILVGSGEHARLISIDLEPRPEAPSRVGPLVLGGVGLAFAGAGGVLWALGKSAHSDLESTCAPEGACSTADVDSAKLKLVLGDVSMLVGAVAFVSAVTWWLVTQPSPGRAPTAAPPPLGTFRF